MRAAYQSLALAIAWLIEKPMTTRTSGELKCRPQLALPAHQHNSSLQRASTTARRCLRTAKKSLAYQPAQAEKQFGSATAMAQMRFSWNPITTVARRDGRRMAATSLSILARKTRATSTL